MGAICGANGGRARNQAAVRVVCTARRTPRARGWSRALTCGFVTANFEFRLSIFNLTRASLESCVDGWTLKWPRDRASMIALALGT